MRHVMMTRQAHRTARRSLYYTVRMMGAGGRLQAGRTAHGVAWWRVSDATAPASAYGQKRTLSPVQLEVRSGS
jgi:hypothetical protein